MWKQTEELELFNLGFLSLEKRREPTRKSKRDFSQRYVVTGQGAFNLEEDEYTLDMRNFFMRVVKYWQRLSTEVMDAPSNPRWMGLRVTCCSGRCH